MSEHVHRFRRIGLGDPNVLEACRCGQERPRKATADERRRYQALMKRQDAEAARMHGIYWKFHKEFRTEGPNPRWAWTGSELMERIEEWAKKHPRDVFVAGIDDGTHSSSILAFILHRDGRRNWGTSVVGVTQNDGQPPFEYFMYPGHALEIGWVLQALGSFKPWHPDPLTSSVHERWKKKTRPFGIRLR